MSWFSSKKSELSWNHINSAEDLNLLFQIQMKKQYYYLNILQDVLLVSMAKSRLEDKWYNDIKIQPYYLDLIAFRDVSNQIADRLIVIHQSPQVIVIRNESCVGSFSHNEISLESILKLIKLTFF